MEKMEENAMMIVAWATDEETERKQTAIEKQPTGHDENKQASRHEEDGTKNLHTATFKPNTQE